jgi:hypothetical protein
LIRIKPTLAIQRAAIIAAACSASAAGGCARECEALRFAPASPVGTGAGPAAVGDAANRDAAHGCCPAA